MSPSEGNAAGLQPSVPPQWRSRLRRRAGRWPRPPAPRWSSRRRPPGPWGDRSAGMIRPRASEPYPRIPGWAPRTIRSPLGQTLNTATAVPLTKRTGPVAKETMMDTMEAVIEGLARQKYVADRSIGMAVYLALRMEKPLRVEGEPGCGKTEIARTLAAALGSDLIRLQCYEGLDADATLYEWNHPKQLLTILIDEIDRADEEFEGLLLEFLSDFQITIPEIGTIRAKRAPRVVITSNRTRELSDALKRRCLYLYIGYPTREKEISILRRKVPELGEQFANEITGFVQQVRAQDDFVKRPGISETLEWASALIVLRTAKLDRDIVEQTLGLLIKDAQDLQTMQSGRLDSILGTP